MSEILRTFISLVCKAIFFMVFAFCGIKIGIALRKRKNDKEKSIKE